MRYSILLLLGLFLVSGCSFIRTVQIPTPTAVILNEDKIYTLKAGVKISNVTLDGKDIGELTFPYDMKLCSPNVLVKQEEKLDNAILDKVKADKNHSQAMTIFGSIMAFLAGLTGIWLKAKLSSSTKK